MSSRSKNKNFYLNHRIIGVLYLLYTILLLYALFAVAEATEGSGNQSAQQTIESSSNSLLSTTLITTTQRTRSPTSKKERENAALNGDGEAENVISCGVLMDFPLLGVGVGNLQHDQIGPIIITALQATAPVDLVSDSGPSLLIDTAHASQNEGLIRESIDSYVTSITANKVNNTGPIIFNRKLVVHIVTKVWYTHLGYERTKLSVQESLRELRTKTLFMPEMTGLRGSTAPFATAVRRNEKSNKSNINNEHITLTDEEAYVLTKNKRNLDVDIRVHVMLHWPRCRTDISWMDCDGEENRLSDTVKAVGPKPDPATAFLDSWKALEDLFLLEQEKQLEVTNKGNVSHTIFNHNTNLSNVDDDDVRIASIGVSNFDEHDMDSLLAIARVKPHIVQINVWTYVFNHRFVQLCQKNFVHIQVYNVINGIVPNYRACPRAYSSLEKIATLLMSHLQQQYNDNRNNNSDTNGNTQTTTNNGTSFISSVSSTSPIRARGLRNNMATVATILSSSITVLQVVFSWLICNRVSIVPRTGNVQHYLEENSPKIMAPIVAGLRFIVEDAHMEWIDPTILKAVQALLQRKDLADVRAIFRTKTNNERTPVSSIPLQYWDLYWYNPETNEEILIDSKIISPDENGNTYSSNTHPGHVFVVRQHNSLGNNKNLSSLISQKYVVTADYGSEQFFYFPSLQEKLIDNRTANHDMGDDEAWDEHIEVREENIDDEEL